jgi:penicillin-binding protein 1A
MRVQTTVDTEFQRMAEQTVGKWHERLLGRGLYKNQMALVAIDPRTHYIKALVGGVDAKTSEFNRATQALRQPGSSFKPFVYYAAFATGKYSPDTTVYDTPVSYRDGDGWYYPRNYDGSFGGSMSIRHALAQSRNIPVIKLGKTIGMNKVVEACRTLGIMSPMEPVTSLPLGAIGVTPLEMASAYATFANYGWQSPATVIVRVTDSSGNVLLDNTPKPQLVLDPWASAATIDVMRSVITEGTGKNAAIGRPAAGKTGTTSSEKDIWFVGTVPQLTTAVWIGRDDNKQLASGATGGVVVAPIWADFMNRALKNVPAESFKPPSKFPRPKD